MKIRYALSIALVGILSLGVLAIAQADSPTEGRGGRAEVRFLQGMIDHHQMALDMSEDCLAKATDDALKTLCQNIIAAQTAEIKQMQRWLSDWYGITYVPMPMAHMMGMEGMAGHGGTYKAEGTSGGHGGHGGHGGGDAKAMPSDPPMMMGMMAGLSRLEGKAYGVAWLEAMIDHHDDALHMATRILKWANHAELRAMAEAIIKDQTAEIALMENMIKALIE